MEFLILKHQNNQEWNMNEQIRLSLRMFFPRCVCRYDNVNSCRHAAGKERRRQLVIALHLAFPSWTSTFTAIIPALFGKDREFFVCFLVCCLPLTGIWGCWTSALPLLKDTLSTRNLLSWGGPVFKVNIFGYVTKKWSRCTVFVYVLVYGLFLGLQNK